MKTYTLIPPDLMATIPPLYSTEKTPLKSKTVVVKLFCSGLTWFVTEGEFDKERDDYLMFGYVVNESTPIFSEWGYIPLGELEAMTAEAQVKSGRFLGTIVERDLYFEPTLISELVPNI